MQIDPIIEPLLRSSKLPVYLEELNTFYAEEKKRRTAFYEMLTDEMKAEFIEGEVVIHSPARNEHIDCCGYLFQLLAAYVNINNLGSVKSEKALIKLSRNDFEPDICFFNKEKTKAFQNKTMFFPAPDFIVEILSDSTEGRDRGVKFNDYASHGVAEYWIVNAEKGLIEQYVLEEGNQYVLHVKVNDGTISSRVVNGFAIPVKAVFQKETNVKTLQSILTK